MRENKKLQASFGSLYKVLFWCLFATSYPLAAFSQSSDFVYDSSLQRSNFMSLSPDYVDKLEAELSDRRSVFFWKLRFYSQNLETASNINQQIAGATFRSKFTYRFLESLTFKAKGNLTMMTGRVQNIFGAQQVGTGIYPRELKLQYEPIADFLTLDFGMIHQRFFNNQLFVGNLGFVGTSQRMAYKQPRFEVALRTQQLIPTSYTNSTRVADRETMPSFYTESLEGKFLISRNNFINGRLTHFQYNNLPHIAAFQSFIYGNTVTNTDVNNAQFIYGFNGFMSQLTFEQRISDSLSAQVMWDVIKNNQAPSDAGEARKITLAVANDFGRWILSGSFTDYFIESDAVPARYNSSVLGHNNRIGNSLQLGVESKDWGVDFKLNYVKADLLNQATMRIDGLQQDNQQSIYLSVETLYDFI